MNPCWFERPRLYLRHSVAKVLIPDCKSDWLFLERVEDLLTIGNQLVFCPTESMSSMASNP